MTSYDPARHHRHGRCHRCLVSVGLAPVGTAMTCDLCKRPVGLKGTALRLCDPHYRRYVRYGDAKGRPEAYQVTQSFKGMGRIKCAACGDPVRDHSLTEPCEMADLRG